MKPLHPVVILSLTLALLSAPLATDAQPVDKVARIGVLCATRCEGASFDALRAGLRDLGWIEGRNLVIEPRAAGGQLDRLPALARERVALGPALIEGIPSSTALPTGCPSSPPEPGCRRSISPPSWSGRAGSCPTDRAFPRCPAAPRATWTGS